jgi:hypothetical protein
METGLFEIQAEHLHDYRQARQLLPNSRDLIHAMFGRPEAAGQARELLLSACSRLYNRLSFPQTLLVGLWFFNFSRQRKFDQAPNCFRASQRTV